MAQTMSESLNADDQINQGMFGQMRAEVDDEEDLLLSIAISESAKQDAQRKKSERL